MQALPENGKVDGMTVKLLIAKLTKLENQNAQVVIGPFYEPLIIMKETQVRRFSNKLPRKVLLLVKDKDDI